MEENKRQNEVRSADLNLQVLCRTAEQPEQPSTQNQAKGLLLVSLYSQAPTSWCTTI